MKVIREFLGERELRQVAALRSGIEEKRGTHRLHLRVVEALYSDRHAAVRDARESDRALPT